MTANFQQVPLALADVNKLTAPARRNKFCGSRSKISILKKDHTTSRVQTRVPCRTRAWKARTRRKKERCGINHIFPSSNSSEKPDFQQTAGISNYDTLAWPPHLSKVINPEQCSSSFQLWSCANQKPNSISHFTAYLWGWVHKLTSVMLEKEWKGVKREISNLQKAVTNVLELVWAFITGEQMNYNRIWATSAAKALLEVQHIYNSSAKRTCFYLFFFFIKKMK